MTQTCKNACLTDRALVVGSETTEISLEETTTVAHLTIEEAEAAAMAVRLMKEAEAVDPVNMIKDQVVVCRSAVRHSMMVPTSSLLLRL